MAGAKSSWAFATYKTVLWVHHMHSCGPGAEGEETLWEAHFHFQFRCYQQPCVLSKWRCSQYSDPKTITAFSYR